MSKRDAWFYRMKAANRDLIEMCGGIVRAADIAELSIAQIGKCNNVEDDSLLSARATARLEADLGRPIVSRAGVEAVGWRVHQVAPAPSTEAGCPHLAIGRISSEMADVMRAYVEGCSDGRYSPADAGIVAKELAELARAVENGRLSSAALMGGRSDE